MLERIMERAEQALSDPSEVGEPDAAEVAAAWFDFLIAEPNFLRLLRWDTLTVSDATAEAEDRPLQRIVALLAERLRAGGIEPDDVGRAVVALLSLSWFPLAHREVLRDALGVELTSRRGLEAHKRDVIGFVLSREAPTAVLLDHDT